MLLKFSDIVKQGKEFNKAVFLHFNGVHKLQGKVNIKHANMELNCLLYARIKMSNKPLFYECLIDKAQSNHESKSHSSLSKYV